MHNVDWLCKITIRHVVSVEGLKKELKQFAGRYEKLLPLCGQVAIFLVLAYY